MDSEDKEFVKLNAQSSPNPSSSSIENMSSTNNFKNIYTTRNQGIEAIPSQRIYTSLPSIPSNHEIRSKITDLKTHHHHPQPISPILPRYRWIIVLSCFVNFFIVDGIGHSLSLFFIAFCNHLDYSRSQLSWIVSIHFSMTLVSGPVASLLVDELGCGKANMLGSFLTFAGFFVSSWTKHLWVLILSIGFVAGLGVCLIYVSSYSIIALNFTGKKALATGIFSSGSGVGALILGPLTNFLIQKYMWQGATLVYSALFLNLLVTGYLMLRASQLPASEPSLLDNKDIGSDHSMEYQLVSTDNAGHQCNHHSLYKNVDAKSCKGNNKIILEIKDDKGNDDALQTRLKPKSLSLHHVSYESPHVILKTPSIHKNSGSISLGSQRFINVVYKYFNHHFLLFKNTEFLLFFVSNFILYASGDTPCLFFFDKVTGMGIVKNSGILISVMGMANTIGHLFFGFLSDYTVPLWGPRSTLYIYSLAIIISGTATITVPTIYQIYSTIIFTILLGFFISANYTLTSIITLDMVGNTSFTGAFGIILTAQGLGALIGAPIGGAFIDSYQNYDLAFYIAGFVIIVSGVMMVCMPLLSYFKTKQIS